MVQSTAHGASLVVHRLVVERQHVNFFPSFGMRPREDAADPENQNLRHTVAGPATKKENFWILQSPQGTNPSRARMSKYQLLSGFNDTRPFFDHLSSWTRNSSVRVIRLQG